MKLIREFAVPRRNRLVDQPDALGAQPPTWRQIADPAPAGSDATRTLSRTPLSPKFVEQGHQLDLRRGARHRQQIASQIALIVD